LLDKNNKILIHINLRDKTNPLPDAYLRNAEAFNQSLLVNLVCSNVEKVDKSEISASLIRKYFFTKQFDIEI
jgi:hypothetical protein